MSHKDNHDDEEEEKESGESESSSEEVESGGRSDDDHSSVERERRSNVINHMFEEVMDTATRNTGRKRRKATASGSVRASVSSVSKFMSARRTSKSTKGSA